MNTIQKCNCTSVKVVVLITVNVLSCVHVVVSKRRRVLPIECEE